MREFLGFLYKGIYFLYKGHIFPSEGKENTK